MRTKVLRPVNALTKLDLPTLLRPAKAISVIWEAGSCSSLAAPKTNLHSPAKSFRARSNCSGVNSTAANLLNGILGNKAVVKRLGCC